MAKNKVLGHDPLGWMKATKEEKEETADERGQKTAKEDIPKIKKNIVHNIQRPVSRSGVEQQQTPPHKEETAVSESESEKEEPKADNKAADTTQTPKPKVVIGRLYEQLSREKITPVQENENASVIPRKHVAPAPLQSAPLQTMGKIEAEGGRETAPASASQITTYIVIAYTVLLLILGFFVYRDLSKRTSRVEAKLFALEKALLLQTEED